MPSVPLHVAVAQGGFVDATCFLVVALAPDAPVDLDPKLAPLFLLAGLNALEANEADQATPATLVQ